MPARMISLSALSRCSVIRAVWPFPKGSSNSSVFRDSYSASTSPIQQPRRHSYCAAFFKYSLYLFRARRQHLHGESRSTHSSTVDRQNHPRRNSGRRLSDRLDEVLDQMLDLIPRDCPDEDPLAIV